MYFLQTSLAEVFYNSLVSGNLTDILSELNIAILTLLLIFADRKKHVAYTQFFPRNFAGQKFYIVFTFLI